MDQFFVKHHRDFQKIFDSNEPHNLPIPGHWDEKLTYF